jgi:hypothetical protein
LDGHGVIPVATRGGVKSAVGRCTGLAVEAAIDLAEEGYLLNEDVPAIVRHAAQHWDYLMSPAQR